MKKNNKNQNQNKKKLKSMKITGINKKIIQADTRFRRNFKGDIN